MRPGRAHVSEILALGKQPGDIAARPRVWRDGGGAPPTVDASAQNRVAEGGHGRCWTGGVDLLAPMAAAWVVGLLAGPLLPDGVWRPVAGLAVLGTGLAVAVVGRQASGERLERWGGLGLAFLALGAGLAMAREPPPVPEVPRGLARVTARVLASDAAGERSRALLRVEHGQRMEDGAPVPPGALVRVYGRRMVPGARVGVLLRLEPHTPFRNPSPHPELPAADPVAARAGVPGASPVRMLEPPSLPRRALEWARDGVRARLHRTLSDDVSGVARALVLGEGRAVRPSERQAVRDAGLSHVLAVSGLHVAIVAGMIVWLVGRAWLRVPALALRLEARRVAAAVGIPAALGFAAFAGGAPSAWRAAVTASLGWALIALGRRPRATRVLGLAVLVLAATAPSQAHRPGFLLSVAATVALVTSPPIDSPWRSVFVLSARAMVGTAPLVLWWFGSVPVIGLLGNVVLVPVGSLLLVPLAVIHAAAAVATPFDMLTAPVLTVVARGFVQACEVLSLVSWGRGLPPPSVLQGLTLAAACTALLFTRRWVPRALVITATVASLLAAEVWLRHAEQPRDMLRVTFLDVGQGDAALVDLPDGRAMLVDAGGVLRGPDPGARALLPLLRARRRQRVDLVVITHPHPDHYGGLEALLDEVDIGEAWAIRQSDVEDPDGPATGMLRALRARGTRLVRPDALCDGTRPYGGADLDVLWPCPGYDAGLDPNDNSIVVRLTYGRVVILFTGDVEELAEATLARCAGSALRAHVLKVGHHGSRTSSTDPFLDAVRPRWAVVSAGRHNQFGHPHPEVVARYRERGVPLARTDRMGAVVLETDGRTMDLRTWRGDRWTTTVRQSARVRTQPLKCSSADVSAVAPPGPTSEQLTSTPTTRSPMSR
jgi:competence protein ComEC